MRNDWIRIEDLSRFMIKGGIKQYHPDDPKHTSYWRKLKGMCIEGLWGEDFNGFRYMPGRLFFYGHFCTIIDTDEEEKVRRRFRPSISDLEWERAYLYLEAEGFSGWRDDDLYTSNHKIFTIKKSKATVDELSNPALFRSDGRFKEFINPRDNIRMIHKQSKGLPYYSNPTANILEMGSRSGGKMESIDNQLLTNRGWIRMGNITLDDKVYGRDGKLHNITAIHPQGKQRIWRITFQDGRTIDCGAEHLWVVKLCSGIEKVISTEDMYCEGLTYQAKKGHVYKYRVPNCQPIQFDTKELPIDPYILGCLLGDGTMTTKTPNLAKVGNRLTQALKELEVNKKCSEKFIPEIYLNGDIEQRFELLRGLIDTDGSVNTDGCTEFTNTNYKLACQVASLCRSLGIRCKLIEGTKEGELSTIKGHTFKSKTCWRVLMNTTKDVAKLPRKLNRIKNKKPTLSQDFVAIVKIEKTEEFIEQQCITVDNEDHTYITKDYIVTHNSYFYSLAGAKYRIVFDGIKYYTDENRMNPPEIDIVVGSGRTDKSSEFCAKIESSMNELAINNELGTWGKPGDTDYEPSPLFKQMNGSLKPNNKENPWIHEYDMKVGGRWLSGFGTKTKLYHVTYSSQKKDGAEAAAGGRYTDLYYEEIGLLEKLIEAYNSNRATVATGNQFGVQVFLGTSGNMETVGPAKKMFTHPKDYQVLSYPDQYEGSGEIGLFLPAYMTHREFKDKNGNTNIEEALAHFQKRRDEAAMSDDPSVLRVEKMNHPIIPSDMWQTGKGYILPSAEAEEREKQLMKNNLYEKIGTPIILREDSSKRNGVDYNIHHNAEPFYEFPLETNSNRIDISGAVMIYSMPIEERGEVPSDMYVFTHDPYVSDEIDKGGSLGTVHVWLNPKYWDKYLTDSPLVATYIGKAKGGKREFYSNLEKLMAFYGNPVRGLWYEANRGEYCRGYFHKKGKAKLLGLRPQYEKGDAVYEKQVTQYGYIVGNRVAKLTMLDDLSDFLLKPIPSLNNKLVIETLPCIFTIRQIKLYDIDGNFDAVSSILGFPLYIREEEHRLQKEMSIKRGKRNPLAFLSVNSKLMPKINKHVEQWQ